MKRTVVSLMLALVLILIPATEVLAATSQNVEVTATPEYIAISNTPGTWTVNGIGGSGVIATSTTYYSNPQGDTSVPSDPVATNECRFAITNTSTVAIDLVANFPNHSGGDASTNSDNGSAGATSFGAYGYTDNMTTYASDRVVMQVSGGAVLKDALVASANISWGIEYSSQTDTWTSGTNMTSTVVITATAD